MNTGITKRRFSLMFASSEKNKVDSDEILHKLLKDIDVQEMPGPTTDNVSSLGSC